MSNNFSIITAEAVNNIVNKNPNKVYEAVKTAYIRHGQNQTINPPSHFLKFPGKIAHNCITGINYAKSKNSWYQVDFK